jgi:ankyrin repeat protein
MSSARTSLSAEVGNGHTALMRAALEGNTARVKALLRRGANVNAKDLEGHTALMFAVVNLHSDIVKLLLEHGADVNASANDGLTALMLAASCGDAAVVRALLDKGADKGCKLTRTGKNAAMLAAEKGYTAIVDLLKG